MGNFGLPLAMSMSLPARGKDGLGRWDFLYLAFR